MKQNKFKYLLPFLFLVGCAGLERDCSSCNASNFGSDWIVVQYRNDGLPINCWQLKDTPISNESGTDGIFWKSPSDHLIHISGWYNRVQVTNHRFGEAAAEVGIKLNRCPGGSYLSE